MTGDRPLTDSERGRLRLIITGPTDNVMRANQWCEENGAEIQFEEGRFEAVRGGEVLATATDLGVLLGKLERPGP